MSKQKNENSSNSVQRTQYYEAVEPPTGGDGSTDIALSNQSHRYIKAATADNTRKTYRAAIRRFEHWGGRLPTDANTLVQYLTAQAGQLNPRTLSVHINALSQWHRVQQLYDPTQETLVRKTLEGIHRLHGKPKRKAKALKLEHIAQMLRYLDGQPETPQQLRNKALLLVGFFGAFRCSELVGIHVEHLVWESDGVLIELPRSKTDQLGQGKTRGLPYYVVSPANCPATALKQWLDVADIKKGPIFRGINRWQQIQDKSLYPGSVTDILKSIGKSCDFDFVPELSSHSFRRGLSTSASRENVDFALIKQQGGWQNDETVRGYIEEGRLLSHNAATPLLEKLTQLLDDQ